MLEGKIKVAIGDTFLDGLVRLPKTVQKSTIKFIRKFENNPTMPGLNYEKIKNADSNLRSLRIDQTYRAIVLKPEMGNVYVVLWVDHHDDAYAWATRKKVSVHPKTGSLQILTHEEDELVFESDVESDDLPALFDAYRDRELRRFGLPDALIPETRAVRTKTDLLRLKDKLPAEAFEALYWLSEGDSLEEVHRALMIDPVKVDQQEFDTEDIAAALERPGSQRHFVLIEDDEDLERILNAPLERWRVFLHPVQRKLVEREWNGPVRVLGGAGTGKTVVAMHRAKWLVENVYRGPDDRVLFTTFTKNLAQDINENLRTLCKPEVMRKIEVVNLDQWVSNFLKTQGYAHEVHYYSENGELGKIWTDAMTQKPKDVDLPDSFYREEWERVIQDEGVETMRDYFRVARTGRGQGLHRSIRKKVWAVFEEYRNLLARREWREAPDAMRDARNLLAAKGDVLPYRAVIVDEAQDMGSEAFRLIRTIVTPEQPNDLYIVGDAHQRIYRHRVVMKRCGINIVGRANRLRINYRTTDEIRKFAVGVLEGLAVDDLDGGEDSVKGYVSLMHGAAPEVKLASSFDEEVDAIAAFIGEDREAWKDVCVIARTNKLVGQYRDALKAKGVKTHEIKRRFVDDRSVAGVRLATMHRVKGLEFERIVVAGMNDGVMPLKQALQTDDDAVREDAEAAERSLLYVSLTRAKRAALVTSNGKPSPFVHGFE